MDGNSLSSYSFGGTPVDSPSPCKGTKFTYSPDPIPGTFSAHEHGHHRAAGRSKSEPSIRLTDIEDQNETGLEPNCDLFGIQLEVNIFLSFTAQVVSGRLVLGYSLC